jgi:16S rRNA (guanine(966)-N(2))-methyltransferase RsmD
VRVIAGKAKGLRLETPTGARIRPTLDRVREALFSILTPRLDGARFLDLFAGTGANGIEALSRGVGTATFVDSHPDSIAVIERNLERSGLAQRAECVRLLLPQGLPRLARGRESYDIVFADPPRAFDEFHQLLSQLDATNLLTEGGSVIFEHGTEALVPDAVEPWCRFRHTQYGNTCLSFYAVRASE